MMTTMNKVLILIILEYIYILQVGCCYSGLCLNPYYTGIHLHKGNDWVIAQMNSS